MLPDLTCVSLSGCPSVSLDTASFAGVGKNTGGAEVDSARDCGLLGFLRSPPFETPWMESRPPALLCPRESSALKEEDCFCFQGTDPIVLWSLTMTLGLLDTGRFQVG